MNLQPDTLEQLLAFHYDRRERLLEFANSLPPGELVQAVQCTWGSSLGILLHCLACEEFWFHHVIGGQVRQRRTLAEYPDLGSVRRFAQEVRSQTMAWACGLTQAALAAEVVHQWPSGGTARFTVGGAILHVVTHECYHRGQVLLLAGQNGHDIPDLDYL